MATSTLIRVPTNPKRVKSILEQAQARMDLTALMDAKEHATFITEAYYEVIKELATALLLLDGYKSPDHVGLLRYLSFNRILKKKHITVLDELRQVRHRITYEGFAVKPDYLERKGPLAKAIIAELKDILNAKLSGQAGQ